MAKPSDIIGRASGRLVARKFHHEDKTSQFWLAKCECGRTRVVLRADLLGGKVHACEGCLLNRHSGQLTVVRFHHEDATGQFWVAKCPCGRTCVVSRPRLLAGKVRACDACEKGISHAQTPLAIERAKARNYRYAREQAFERKLKRQQEFARNYDLESRPAIKVPPLPKEPDHG
jgi:hypothetical protein